MNKFTTDELNRVDQEQFRDELFVLRHSPAARATFAKAQWNLELSHDSEETRFLFYVVASELMSAIGEIALEIAHRHPIAYHRWNPNRKWVPGYGKFMRLAEELGNESKCDRFGEDRRIRTICGWLTV
jgi:hypothetical protein